MAHRNARDDSKFLASCRNSILVVTFFILINSDSNSIFKLTNVTAFTPSPFTGGIRKLCTGRNNIFQSSMVLSPFSDYDDAESRKTMHARFFARRCKAPEEKNPLLREKRTSYHRRISFRKTLATIALSGSMWLKGSIPASNAAEKHRTENAGPGTISRTKDLSKESEECKTLNLAKKGSVVLVLAGAGIYLKGKIAHKGKSDDNEEKKFNTIVKNSEEEKVAKAELQALVAKAEAEAAKMKAEQERIAAEKVAAEKRIAERIEAERISAAKAAEEKAAKLKAEQERMASLMEAERIAAKEAEAEKVAEEEAARLKADEERVAAIKNAEKIAMKEAEAKKAAEEEAARLKADEERTAAIAEAERIAAKEAEAEKIAEEKVARLKADEERVAAISEAERIASENPHTEEDAIALETKRLEAEKVKLEKEISLEEKYKSIPDAGERAFRILVDLGMVEIHSDPDDPSYDHTADNDFAPENTMLGDNQDLD